MSLVSTLSPRFGAAFAIAAFILLSKSTPCAEPLGTIAGSVVSNRNDPASGASVTLVELRRRTTADEKGAFRFERVPPGKYLIEVLSPRFGSALVPVTLKPGETAELTIPLDLTVHTEEVVVSASLDARSSLDVARPVTVLDSSELQSRMQPTIGETLAQEPGVSATSYSPGASRPVIRGFGGDRIRVLENGIGVGDASNVSEDHAVTTDPLGAEKIEIVRGPSTLLYGSNAGGGVVNVTDGRVPDHVPDRFASGSVDLRYGSNAEEKSGALSVRGGAKAFGWQIGGIKRKTEDFETPDGVLENSDLDTKSGTAGASWIAERGFVGLAYSRFETNYGIPTPEGVRIDMEQRRWDLGGELYLPSGFLRSVRVRAGKTDYEHTEIESSGAPGTQFLNDGWEGRVEVPHRQAGPFQGAFGVQYSNRDLEAIGDEAFVPPTATRTGALFLFEQIGSGKVVFEAGARVENQDTSAAGGLPGRSFNALSASGGVLWKPDDDHVLALTLSRSERNPTAEELYANGPHLATFQFVIGDPDLGQEAGLGLDITLKKRKGFLSGEVSLFANRFSDFILLAPTGNVVDVDGELLPEFAYLQADSEFRGVDAHVDLDILHKDPHHLTIELIADYVRAEVRDGGEPLPRIPPLHAGVGVKYQGSQFWGLVEARRTSRQDRVAEFETTTGGYTWLNASVGLRLFAGSTVHDLVLRGTNMTDRLARNHVSPLKDEVPLQGRDVALAYKLAF